MGDGKPAVGRPLDHPFNVAAAHQFGDHVGLISIFAQVEDSDDMRVGSQAPHGLRFPGYAGFGDIVQPFGPDQGESNFPVQEGVVGEVDPFLAPLTQEPLHLVTAVGKDHRLLVERSGDGSSGRNLGRLGRIRLFLCSISRRQEAQGVGIVGVQGKHSAATVTNEVPV